MATNINPAPDTGPQSAPTVKNPDGTNPDGTVTITLNRTAINPDLGGLIQKGQKVDVAPSVADTLQDGWLLATRSDVPDFKDPSALPEAPAASVSRSNWEAKQKRMGK